MSIQAVLYHNPPNYRYFTVTVFISAAICYVVGSLLFLVSEVSVWKASVSFGIGSIFIVTIWFREFVETPGEVIVQQDGIVLNRRYGLKPRKVGWNEILGVGSINWHGELLGKKDGEGALAISTGQCWVSKEIADAIAVGYMSMTGLTLLEWDIKKNEKYKDFKKRALRLR